MLYTGTLALRKSRTIACYYILLNRLMSHFFKLGISVFHYHFSS